MDVPHPNSPAPDFELPDARGRRVSLADFRGRNVVLAFYPGDWTPVCGGELSVIQETLDEIHAYNAEVIAISCDSVPSHREWAAHLRCDFPLLADFWPHGAVAQKYGLFREPEGFCNRALIFIDSTGTVRDSWVAETPDIAPGIDVVFEGLETLRSGRAGSSATEDTFHA